MTEDKSEKDDIKKETASGDETGSSEGGSSESGTSESGSSEGGSSEGGSSEGGSTSVSTKEKSSVVDVKEAPDEPDKKKKRGKVKKVVAEGTVHIRATFNNTMVTIATLSGDVLCHQSAGSVGFKGSRKGTPFAAQQAVEHAVKVARDNFQMRRANIEVSGAGGGRDSAIRAVKTSGLEVMSIQEKTRIPHNGCKPSKKRRV